MENRTMRRNLTHAHILGYWLNVLNHDSAVRCIGEDWKKLITTAARFSLSRLPAGGQTLWELPLLGEPHCDLSFCYNRDIMANNGFLTGDGKRIGALLWYLLNLLPDTDVWSEVDIPPGEAAVDIPSVFINVGDKFPLIYERTWAQGSRPPQWELLPDLCQKAGESWKLHYIGLMPGRDNNPLRLIFKRPDRDGITAPAGVDLVKSLWEGIGVVTCHREIFSTLQRIETLGWQEWEVGVDLYPDGSLGKMLGVEICLMEDGGDFTRIFSAPKWLALQNCLENLGLADGRLRLLSDLAGKKVLSIPDEDMGVFVYSFLSHIKLRWYDGEALAAKAYLNHDYSLIGRKEI